jgi:hypothetical protein
MKHLTRAVIAVVAIVGAARSTVGAQTQSATDHVQQFLNWYTVQLVSDSGWKVVHRHRAELLGPDLVALLRADEAAKDKSPDQPVGMDWDPFIGVEEPCELYRAVEQPPQLPLVVVSVFEACRGRDAERVRVELTRRDDKWVMTNFYYVDRGRIVADLRSSACELAKKFAEPERQSVRTACGGK